MDRVSRFEREGCRFEPCRDRQSQIYCRKSLAQPRPRNSRPQTQWHRARALSGLPRRWPSDAAGKLRAIPIAMGSCSAPAVRPIATKHLYRTVAGRGRLHITQILGTIEAATARKRRNGSTTLHAAIKFEDPPPAGIRLRGCEVFALLAPELHVDVTVVCAAQGERRCLLNWARPGSRCR